MGMAAAALLPWHVVAATFGTVIPVHGSVSDIAADEKDGLLFAANFSAYRVEVINIANRTLVTSIPVEAPPSAVAVSPDNHYLIIGLYQTPASSLVGGFQPDTGGLDIFDLTTGSIVRRIALPSPVLSVTFGGDGKALVTSRAFAQLPSGVECATGAGSASNILLLDPASGTTQPIAACVLLSRLLPQDPSASEPDILLSVAPMQIIQTAAGVSGDGKRIRILGAAVQDDSATSTNTVFLTYDVASQSIGGGAGISSPAMGPRSVVSDTTGANILEGWSLDSSTCLAIPANPCQLAQFPHPDGRFQVGSHAWDTLRNPDRLPGSRARRWVRAPYPRHRQLDRARAPADPGRSRG